MQNGLRRTFERMDVLKALPLRGWPNSRWANWRRLRR